MRTAARQRVGALPVSVVATMRPVAEVAHDLGIRTEIELPRLPGVAACARALAATVGVRATVVLSADGISVRFTP